MPIALWDSKAVGELREYSSLLPIRISECAEKLAGLSQFTREREL